MIILIFLAKKQSPIGNKSKLVFSIIFQSLNYGKKNVFIEPILVLKLYKNIIFVFSI